MCHWRADYPQKLDTRHGFVSPTGTSHTAVLDSMLFNKIRYIMDTTGSMQGMQFDWAPQHFHRRSDRK